MHALKQALTLPGMSRSKLGRDLGIDPSQVSRIAAGHFVKLEGHALKLCKYAQVLILSRKATQVGAATLDTKLAQLLAVNPEAAKALSELIDALTRDAA